MNHISQNKEGKPRRYAKSPTVQDVQCFSQYQASSAVLG